MIGDGGLNTDCPVDFTDADESNLQGFHDLAPHGMGEGFQDHDPYLNNQDGACR